MVAHIGPFDLKAKASTATPEDEKCVLESWYDKWVPQAGLALGPCHEVPVSLQRQQSHHEKCVSLTGFGIPIILRAVPSWTNL